MQSYSINGLLKPVDDSPVTDEYQGHFIKVSYIQEIAHQPVYSKDRVDVEADGSFRFFLPQKDLLENELITLEVYAPDGLLMGRQVYSYGSLKASYIDVSAEDNSEPLIVVISPRVITFNDTSPAAQATKKLNGRLIDVSGEINTAGLQVIIMVTDVPGDDVDASQFQPVFAAITGKQGYFYGQIDNKEHQQAYGLVAGAEEHPIPIKLENGKFPRNIILATDLSALPDYVLNMGVTAPLPDSDDLVNSEAFSQDIGGKCVDFTVPNRALEEFSFYHTVRTTEPEIRSFTVTPTESRKFRQEFIDISDNLFSLFQQLNNSFNAVSVIDYALDESADDSPVDVSMTGTATPMERASFATTSGIATYQPPTYKLKVASGTQFFALHSHDLLAQDRAFKFRDIIKLLAEQQKRRAKLQALHSKLAQAYCGKHGVQETLSYCDSLTFEDELNRDTLSSLLGHIREYATEMGTTKVGLMLKNYVSELEDMIQQSYVPPELIERTLDKTTQLIHVIDKQVPDTSDREELLGYLRRIVAELNRALDAQDAGFEPCPKIRKSDTMGILCLIQSFEETREILRNNTRFSLGDILLIRSNYDTFIASINTFLGLLDEFHSFYKSSARFAIALEDDYFVEHYSQIKNTLIALRRQIYRAIVRIDAIQREYISNHPGRRELSVEHSIDWDETPTIYENTTIAHGHILHFKQVWKADGYSLGDLLYSLPLAPCQEKQIAILDWDRGESALRQERQDISEEISAQISRDRDISEIMNSALNENMSARSHNDTSSTSAGIGGGIGGFVSGVVFGVAGGVSHSGASSNSSASQNSSRDLSASSLNRLRDTVSQSASSLRSQRSTVVQAVAQNETVQAQTEVIKNHNHCHAMTVEYFEVLKHYAIEQKLVDVQECLFVPLPMSHFDHQKILRWSHSLRRAIYGRKLLKGFDAIERIETDYANSDLPTGTYAEENIEYISGYFTLSFDLTRPYISVIEEATKTEEYDLSIDFPWFLGKMVFHLDREVPLTEAEKDAIFEAQYAPEIVRKFIDTLEVNGIADDGSEVTLDLDYSLLTTYKKGRELRINVASNSIQSVSRNQIKHLRFRANTAVKSSSRIFLRSAFINYRTAHLNEYIIRQQRINNDIINSVQVEINLTTPPFVTIETKTDAALLYTPLNARESRNPRKEDREAAALLVNFLNEHLEMSHKAIWSSMDASRLFGLLDGYIAPNSGNRSVASLVENKIMGVVGNNLVLKVIPGERLDPIFRSVEDLVAYYKPTTPPDPFRISVPTKGVYAESVMGRCNSCEEIDETRHWRFDEAPCGTKPTEIGALSTDSRRADPGNLQVKDLPASIISMQNAPAAPDPTSLAAAYQLLGKGDAFRDITGLAGTQANALGALQTTSKSVTDLASISKDFANLAVMANSKKDGSKQIEQIKQLNKDGYLSDEDTKDQIKKVLDSYNNAAKSVSKSGSEDESVADKIAQKAVEGGLNSPDKTIEYQKVNSEGDSETIKVSAPENRSDSARPIIILTGDTSSAETRAFRPSSNDKTLVISVSATFRNAPEGSYLRWSSPDPDALKIDTPKSNTTRVRGIKPGIRDLDVSLVDAGGTTIASMKLKLSVPQCVTVEEDVALFDAALAAMKLTGQKNGIADEMKRVVEHLHAKSNIRVFWQFGGYAEATPAHVPAANITKATIKNKDPDGNLGLTTGPAAADSFDETIDVFPGNYQEEDDIDVDTETQALIIQLEADLPGDGSLLPIATKIYGRLLGETLSHEIGHALLWDDIPGSGHNVPKIANDLMNRGVDRMFGQRTGMENTVMTSPVEPDHFVDHGLNAIGGFQAHNQALIDNQWPVPPAHA